ncbi:MAG: hypothetical protein SFU98_01725 [Leptospiraceae bacterium]|nr:hypothetical protein [Leptospiraceae bacterium]
MKKRIILLIILCLLSCKKSSAESSEAKILEIQENYKNKIKDTYTISNSTTTSDKAVEELIYEIKTYKLDNEKKEIELNYACNEEETKEILLPNTYDSGTLTSSMEPDKAWDMMKYRKSMGVESIHRKLKEKEIISIQTIWKEQKRNLHSLVGHVVGKVFVRTKEGPIELEEIKLVIEHKNQFKVCVISK